MIFWNWAKNFKNKSKSWMYPDRPTCYRLELEPVDLGNTISGDPISCNSFTYNSDIRIGMPWSDPKSPKHIDWKIKNIWRV